MIIGQDELVRFVLLGLLAGGHVLLEGTPGLGKTLIVKALSQALHLRFSRIQFTPDLMPADITGATVMVRDEAGRADLRFRPGPVFSNIVLADEINRGTPKTQSAMLEAMAERSVTVAGEQRPLEAPFFVIGTQNPIEMEGTYPLPEAQLDRFLFKLVVPYPSLAVLQRIGMETTGTATPTLSAVLDRDGVLDLQALTRGIVVSEAMGNLAARLTLATHPESPTCPASVRRFLRYGASPRATQALLLAGRAHALLEGRAFVGPGDLHAVARPVLRHRVFLGLEAELEGVKSEAVVDAVLESLREG